MVSDVVQTTSTVSVRRSKNLDCQLIGRWWHFYAILQVALDERVGGGKSRDDRPSLATQCQRQARKDSVKSKASTRTPPTRRPDQKSITGRHQTSNVSLIESQRRDCTTTPVNVDDDLPLARNQRPNATTNERQRKQQNSHLIMADHSAMSGEIPEKNGILSAMFASCNPDPRGSVHRAWGISLLFVVLYFVLSIFESK